MVREPNGLGFLVCVQMVSKPNSLGFLVCVQMVSKPTLTVKLVLYDVVEDLQQEEDQVVVGGTGKQEPWGAECLRDTQASTCMNTHKHTHVCSHTHACAHVYAKLGVTHAHIYMQSYKSPVSKT